MAENQEMDGRVVTAAVPLAVADRVAWEDGLRGWLQARVLVVTGREAA